MTGRCDEFRARSQARDDGQNIGDPLPRKRLSEDEGGPRVILLAVMRSGVTRGPAAELGSHVPDAAQVRRADDATLCRHPVIKTGFLPRIPAAGLQHDHQRLRTVNGLRLVQPGRHPHLRCGRELNRFDQGLVVRGVAYRCARTGSGAIDTQQRGEVRRCLRQAVASG